MTVTPKISGGRSSEKDGLEILAAMWMKIVVAWYIVRPRILNSDRSFCRDSTSSFNEFHITT